MHFNVFTPLNICWSQRSCNKFKNKTDNLCKFKESFQREEYINMFMSWRQRSLLAQSEQVCYLFTLHALSQVAKLVFRQMREPVTCRNGNVKDEFHFLRICPEYESCRITLYEFAQSTCVEFHDLAIIDKFIYIMQHNSREVAKYLNSAFNIHEDILYKRLSLEGDTNDLYRCKLPMSSVFLFIIPVFIKVTCKSGGVEFHVLKLYAGIYEMEYETIINNLLLLLLIKVTLILRLYSAFCTWKLTL